MVETARSVPALMRVQSIGGSGHDTTTLDRGFPAATTEWQVAMGEGHSPGRRQVLVIAATALGVAPLLARVTRPAGAVSGSFPVRHTDQEWRARLTAPQYRVLREQGTERAFSSPLDDEKRRGTFACAGCGHPVYSSDTKFDSGTGWPSFWQPLPDAVGTSVDSSWLMVRTEVHCASCGGHLGHVFNDGPRPTGLRYCMNGVAMTFSPLA
jgi:peptide-methionine (R)-S-oxide reductase